PGMRRESTPLWRSGAGRANRSVDVGNAALSDRSQLLPNRGVERVEIFSRCRWLPGSADEEFKAPAVALQPCCRFFRVFGSGSVFHADELFRNAHSAPLACFCCVKTIPPRTAWLRHRVPILGRVTSSRKMFQLPLDISEQAARAE